MSQSVTQPPAHAWVPWQACPPDPRGVPVEVRSSAWCGSRLWRPSGPPPDDALGLKWRPCGKMLLKLAMFGGIYDAVGDPLYGSPPLIANSSDPNGPWAQQFVISPSPRSRRKPVTRLWLVPPCLALVEVPPTVLGDLVAAADHGETVVMRGPDGDQLRAFAAQIVRMTGGWRA